MGRVEEWLRREGDYFLVSDNETREALLLKTGESKDGHSLKEPKGFDSSKDEENNLRYIAIQRSI